MRRLLVALAVFFSFCVSAHVVLAQPQPSQTARQALIEMFFGSAANHMEKHLPDTTRKTLHRMGSASGEDALAQLSMFSMQAKMMGPGFQTFDTGPTLLTAEEPGAREPQKVELTVERDDLVGDEDQIELALHVTKNGKDDTTLPFVPRFTFSMKMESDVWRLNEVVVSVRVPLADPDFLTRIEDEQRTGTEREVKLAIQSIVSVERTYESANGKFACSLSALQSRSETGVQGQPGTVNVIANDLAHGKRGGYIFAISRCDGSSYRVVAEPAAPDTGQRAFCSDENGAIRASADGKATTCLSNGEKVQDGPARQVAMPAVEGTARTQGAPPERGQVRVMKINPAPGRVAAMAAPQSGEPTRAAPRRVRVSQGVSEALVVSKVPPTYPFKGKETGIQGTVVMKAVIGKTGDVEKLELISGHPMLAPAAMDAVKQWKYKPYLLNGSPVEAETQVTVNFALSEE
jgi:TonB family protein